MDKVELVERLHNKANISYEEAKKALENSGWNLLDAMLYLEDHNIIKKPSISIFYTNDNQYNYYNYSEKKPVVSNKSEGRTYSESGFYRVFETICNVIDRGNNIFFEVKRSGRHLFKLPMTVIILLLIFTFWFTIPLMVAGLFLDVEYKLSSSQSDMTKVNNIIAKLSGKAKNIKEIVKKRVNNG